MSISMLVPLPIGNAVKVILEPPGDAVLWRVLRTTGTSFTDENDASAVVVYQGDLAYAVDPDVDNGVAYTYGAFYFDGVAWNPANVAQVTPSANYQDLSTDVLTVLRDRLDRGLQNEITAGSLLPPSKQIEVLNAPPAFDETAWPVVTVHVINDGSGQRALGEELVPDTFDAVEQVWDEQLGWLARAHLSVIGWSKNPDERIALRKSLRRLVIGNLAVFQGCGITQIEFSQSDAEDMGSFPVPVYQTIGTFTCFAPAVVGTSAAPIAEVDSSLTPTYPNRSAASAF